MCLQPNCDGYVLEKRDTPGQWTCAVCGYEYGPPKNPQGLTEVS